MVVVRVYALPSFCDGFRVQVVSLHAVHLLSAPRTGLKRTPLYAKFSVKIHYIAVCSWNKFQSRLPKFTNFFSSSTTNSSSPSLFYICYLHSALNLRFYPHTRTAYYLSDKRTLFCAPIPRHPRTPKTRAAPARSNQATPNLCPPASPRAFHTASCRNPKIGPLIAIA